MWGAAKPSSAKALCSRATSSARSSFGAMDIKKKPPIDDKSAAGYSHILSSTYCSTIRRSAGRRRPIWESGVSPSAPGGLPSPLESTDGGPSGKNRLSAASSGPSVRGLGAAIIQSIGVVLPALGDGKDISPSGLGNLIRYSLGAGKLARFGAGFARDWSRRALEDGGARILSHGGTLRNGRPVHNLKNFTGYTYSLQK